ncbi:hypothetical protein BDF14DRAFT_1762937 [Spinellus fusiger]|nr:hypothetical protein BDF14DRAFT_1762937 [Spinellus fusiger]
MFSRRSILTAPVTQEGLIETPPCDNCTCLHRDHCHNSKPHLFFLNVVSSNTTVSMSIQRIQIPI